MDAIDSRELPPFELPSDCSNFSPLLKFFSRVQKLSVVNSGRENFFICNSKVRLGGYLECIVLVQFDVVAVCTCQKI